ncbi:MAG: hypothetical protein GX593_14670 [Actinomycetales bacterium]|nr:hypothetical protein [Actinomycetales bacterium]
MLHLSRRWRVPAVLAGLAMLAAAGLAIAPAQADVTDQYYHQTQNAADPHVFRCAQPGDSSQLAWCMVTSQDLNQAPIDPSGPGSNYYPMDKTLGQYSPDGVWWYNKTTALNESQIGRSGFKHQWAPAATWLRKSSSVNEYYMYSPNLTNKNNRLSQRLFVTYSGHPTADYAKNNIPGTSSKWREIIPGTGDPRYSNSNAVGWYMSDPDVLIDSTTPGSATANRYLIWANGDYATCGGYSIRKMTNAYTLQNMTSESQGFITINGMMNGNAIDGGNYNNEFDQGLGTCTESNGTFHQNPYIEGASIYRKDTLPSYVQSLPGKYILMFGAKPSVTPGVCRAPGQPNTANSVLAYATSNSVTGPYDYQGIIMCGSSTEWTNQGTLITAKGSGGRERLGLIYHDGKAAPGQTPRNRQLHSECLYVHKGRFLLTARSNDGMSDLGDWGWCLRTDEFVVALKSVSTGKYVTSKSGKPLEATSPRVGLWEQFGIGITGSWDYLHARNPGQYVQVNRNATGKPVIARGAAKGDWEQLKLETGTTSDGSAVRIKDNQGYYWRVGSDGKITAATKNPSSSDKSYWFYTETIWMS